MSARAGVARREGDTPYFLSHTLGKGRPDRVFVPEIGDHAVFRRVDAGGDRRVAGSSGAGGVVVCGAVVHHAPLPQAPGIPTKSPSAPIRGVRSAVSWSTTRITVSAGGSPDWAVSCANTGLSASKAAKGVSRRKEIMDSVRRRANVPQSRLVH